MIPPNSDTRIKRKQFSIFFGWFIACLFFIFASTLFCRLFLGQIVYDTETPITRFYEIFLVISEIIAFIFVALLSVDEIHYARPVSIKIINDIVQITFNLSRIGNVNFKYCLENKSPINIIKKNFEGQFLLIQIIAFRKILKIKCPNTLRNWTNNLLLTKHKFLCNKLYRNILGFLSFTLFLISNSRLVYIFYQTNNEILFILRLILILLSIFLLWVFNIELIQNSFSKCISKELSYPTEYAMQCPICNKPVIYTHSKQWNIINLLNVGYTPIVNLYQCTSKDCVFGNKKFNPAVRFNYGSSFYESWGDDIVRIIAIMYVDKELSITQILDFLHQKYFGFEIKMDILENICADIMTLTANRTNGNSLDIIQQFRNELLKELRDGMYEKIRSKSWIWRWRHRGEIAFANVGFYIESQKSQKFCLIDGFDI